MNNTALLRFAFVRNAERPFLKIASEDQQAKILADAYNESSYCADMLPLLYGCKSANLWTKLLGWGSKVIGGAKPVASKGLKNVTPVATRGGGAVSKASPSANSFNYNIHATKPKVAPTTGASPGNLSKHYKKYLGAGALGASGLGGAHLGGKVVNNRWETQLPGQVQDYADKNFGIMHYLSMFLQKLFGGNVDFKTPLQKAIAGPASTAQLGTQKV